MSRKSRQLVRDPHPDGAVETRLQRIVSLQRAIARKEERLAEGAELVSDLRNDMADCPDEDNTERQRQVDVLLAEAGQLEAEIAGLHDEIEKRVSELSETDLAYLSPRRRNLWLTSS